MLRHTSRGAVSSFLAAERPTVAFLAAICILGIANNVDSKEFVITILGAYS